MAKGRGRRGRRARSHGNGTGNHLRASQSRPSSSGGSFSRALRMESLEDRRMLAVFEVTSLADNGPGTLRQAVELANTNGQADQIFFADFLFEDFADPNPAFEFFRDAADFGALQRQEINLTSGQITINQNLQILGPGATKLAISSGTPNSRIFNIDNDSINIGVTIGGVTLTGGNLVGEEDANGGAIRNTESLTLIETIVADNSASTAGGAVFVPSGNLRVERSIISGNVAAIGGGISMGAPDGDGNAPTVTVVDSTITGNRATGGPELPNYGGGIYNRRGTLNVTNSTIVGNTAGYGSGIASRGNPVPEEEGGDPPAPVVFTNLRNSIIAGNGDPMNDQTDVHSVGMTDDDPPAMLLPSINDMAMGPLHNIIVAPGPQYVPGMGDQIGVDPMLLLDPFTGAPALFDFGGVLPAFIPDLGSPAIDMGSNDVVISTSDQRGGRFVRVADEIDPLNLDPVVDIGAYEGQATLLIVDTLVDENDFQYSDPTTLYFNGDFSLREAIEFSRKNPATDTIIFDTSLVFEDDPVPSTLAPTILLDPNDELLAVDQQFDIDHDVIILGPESFELEINANDPTPGTKGGDGSRIFNITDNDPTSFLEVDISYLTLLNADVINLGGGIFNQENLSLSFSNLNTNGASNDGGGIYTNLGTLTVDSVTLNDNFAADDGGGIYIDADSDVVRITNSTLSSNDAADRGAGIRNGGTDTTVEYSTITLNNSGSTRASGIANVGAGVIDITHTIIAGNNSNDIEYFNLDTTPLAQIISSGYNFVGFGNAVNVGAFAAPGDQAFQLDPMLDVLANTGGRNPTHQPLPGSLVIDAGDPTLVAGVGNVPLNDQRGELYDRIEPTTNIIDIGAYELQGVTYTVTTLIDENDGITGPGFLSLREAIELANLGPLPDVIRFDPSLSAGGQGVLELGIGGLMPNTFYDLRITDALVIDGGSLDLIAIEGYSPIPGLGYRPFTVDDEDNQTLIDVEFRNLTFQNSVNSGLQDPGLPAGDDAGVGGVIRNSENLLLEDVFFVNNRTVNDGLVPGFNSAGGSIYNRSGNLTIRNSTITGSSTTSLSGVGANGGAIYSRDGNVTIDYTSFSGNSTTTANSDGGAFYFRNGTLLFDEASVTGNVTNGGNSRGGGLFLYEGAGELTNVSFINGTVVSGNATIGSSSDGGGVANYGADVTFNDAILTLNTTIGTGTNGGGLVQNGGSTSFENTLISVNRTQGIGSHGAGVANVAGDIDFYKSRIFSNTTEGNGSHGGGIYNTGGTLTVRDSTIDRNGLEGTGGSGGGIFSDSGSFAEGSNPTQRTSIVNSTVSGNTASDKGGGIFNAGGLTEIQNSTITRNQVPVYGFGAGVASYGTGVVPASPGPNLVDTSTRVNNSIIAANTVFEELEADFNADVVVSGLDFLAFQRGSGLVNATKADGDANDDGVVNHLDLVIFETEFGEGPKASDVDRVQGNFEETFESLGYNVIGDGTAIGAFDEASDQTGVTRPGLENLAFNDGNFFFPTHALMAGSPAIDAGDPNFDESTFSPEMTTDQTGNPRVANGVVDVGAYEVPATMEPEGGEPPSLPGDDLNGDGFVSGLDFLAWQRDSSSTAASAVQVAAALAPAELGEPAGEPVIVAESSASSPVGSASSPIVLAGPSTTDGIVEAAATNSEESTLGANPFARRLVFFANLTSLSPEVVWNDIPERSGLLDAFAGLASEFESRLEEELESHSVRDRLEGAFSRLRRGDDLGDPEVEDSVFEELDEIFV